MSVLVAVASRHGATQEIAEAIGKALHGNGFAVDVVKLTDPAESGSRPDPEDYEAVVLGSGVYLGRWLGPAREYLRRNEKALAGMPVWTFASGPLGDLGAGPGQPRADAALVAAIGPVDYRIFAGRLDRRSLGLTERAVVAVMRARDEDDRDWEDITSWSDGIATTLRATAAPRE